MMFDVVYNDDSGDRLDRISTHSTQQEADAAAATLAPVLDTLLKKGRKDLVGMSMEEEISYYHAEPEWAELCKALPTVFTSEVNPYELGFNCWPEIEVVPSGGPITVG